MCTSIGSTLDIESTYKHLVSDISNELGLNLTFPLTGASAKQWLVHDGPILDKAVLHDLEESTTESRKLVPLWLVSLHSKIFSIRSIDVKFLRGLRQLCLFCYKAELPHDKRTTEAAQAAFVEVDTDCGVNGRRLLNCSQQPGLGTVLRIARRYVAKVICNIDWTNIQPSHGPGAVFPRRLAARKSNWLGLYPCVDRYYNFGEYNLLPEDSYDPDVYPQEKNNPEFRFGLNPFSHPLTGTTKDNGIVAKLTAVPKDSRGPRLICIHPAEVIWIQQGQRKLLQQAIEDNVPTLTFKTQSRNALGALSASVTRGHVTMDLKEASDRISCDLVRILFGEHAYGYLSSTRAGSIKLLSGDTIILQKFAPMGNCNIFPIQTLVFWSLVRAAIRVEAGVTTDDIRVFGDDIIYPSEYHDIVVRTLELVGLVVNRNKTFVKGFFRESCGLDAYKGSIVTPIRLKKIDLSERGLVALCDVAKRLRMRGYEASSADIYDTVRWSCKRLKGRLSATNDINCSGIVEYIRDTVTCLDPAVNPSLRWNNDYHRWEVPVLQLVLPEMEVHDDDRYHLLESILRATGALLSRRTRYADPGRERLTRTWAQIVLRDDQGVRDSVRELLAADGRLKLLGGCRSRDALLQLESTWSDFELRD